VRRAPSDRLRLNGEETSHPDDDAGHRRGESSLFGRSRCGCGHQGAATCAGGFQGITPGPHLIHDEPDIFWGLIASFWIGNILLVLLNVPLIGIWVKLLSVPYRYLYPSALFFVGVGVYSANNSFFGVGETIVIGIAGYVLLRLGFHPAPILLGFLLGPRVEENFRRALLLSDGDHMVFVRNPISAVVLGLCIMVVLVQVLVWRLHLRRRPAGRPS
jgi:putative tricarboxylic transport membrane protein